MEKYSNEVKSGCRKIFRNPYDATLESVSTRFAEEGFKKGYDYGKREERAKVFNIQDRIKDFREEMRPICKKYGNSTLRTHTSIWVQRRLNQVQRAVRRLIPDMIEAYVN